jgi:hypothetical protein
MEAHRASHDKPPFLVRLRRTARRVGFVALLLAAALVALKYWGIDRLDEEVRSRVEERLGERFPKLVVKVSSARRVQGKGIEVRGIRISEPAPGATLAYIDDVFAECDTHLPDFLTQVPQFRHLRIRGLKLRADRHADGTWSLAQLLSATASREMTLPPITLENGELQIDPKGRALTLRDINATITPEAPPPGSPSRASTPLLRLKGTLAGEHLDKIELHGLFDPATRQWDLRGAVEGLEFNPRLRAALPREVGDALAPLASIRGRTHFGFRVTSHLPPGSPQGAAPVLEFEVDGQIAEGRVDDSRLPDPLTDLEATIHADNHSLRIEGLSARCGQTVIESLTAELHGLAAGSPLTVSLSAKQVALERLPIASFPESVQEAWRRFKPRGTINLAGTLHFDGKKWHPQLSAECLDLSVEYERFPYRVTDGVGTIKLDYDRLTGDVRFLAGSQTVRCTCDVWNPGKLFTGSVDIRSGGPILIDDRALDALEPQWRKIVQSFHPRGSITFSGRFGRESAADIVHRQIDIDLCKLSIEYDKFRYAIDGVTGRLHQEDDGWTFSNLAGHNDSAQIAGSGKWLATRDRQGNQLLLDFAASSVPLDDELRMALVPGAQRLWTNLRPRGTLDEVKVRLKYNPSGGLAVEVDARKQTGSAASPVSIEPTWFRYRLDDVTGDFAYDNLTGLATLSNVRARHDKTQVQTAGNCRILADGSCGVRLSKLSADRIHPDHELLSALPGGIGQALARLELSGQFNMEGELGVAVPAGDEHPRLDWDLKFDVADGSLNAGLPVENIHGQVQLAGESDGHSIQNRGQLIVDSAIIRGVQFTQIRGPLWIDSQRLLAGTWAERNVQGRVPHWVTANTMDGQLSLDGELVFADGKFQLYTSLENADLSRVMQQLCPGQHNLTGKVFAVVNLGGTSDGVHTWRGQGQVRLKDADIYELPVMVSLLKLLSIQRPDRTAFTTSNMDFRIEGDDLEFTQIDFEGDAISLKGKGWMNSRQEVDLKFYTQLGRDEMQLPFFRPVLGEINRQFLLIEVVGPLDHPHVTKTAFPRLNEQLAQMFPELAARAERERPADARGSAWGPRKLLQPGTLWPRKE